MNPFALRILRGEITTPEELKACYRAEAKRLHPDLQGVAAPGVDFDRLKKHYHEAYAQILRQQDESLPTEPASTPVGPSGLRTRDDFLDEFQNLMARGFPVNIQAAAKNRAYTTSIRRISAWLADHFADPGFFAQVNAETRNLKRSDRSTQWFVMQIFWNIGYYQFTGNDNYRRIFTRHWALIRAAVNDGSSPALARLLSYLVEEA